LAISFLFCLLIPAFAGTTVTGVVKEIGFNKSEVS